MSPIRLVGWVFESSRGVFGSEQVAQGNWWAWWRFQFYFRELGDILTTSIYDCYYLVNKDLKWLLMKYLWNLIKISQIAIIERRYIFQTIISWYLNFGGVITVKLRDPLASTRGFLEMQPTRIPWGVVGIDSFLLREPCWFLLLYPLLQCYRNDPKDPQNRNSSTIPRYISSQMGHFDVVRCLIDAHARVDTAAWRPCHDMVWFDDFGRLACCSSFSSPDSDVMRDRLVFCVLHPRKSQSQTVLDIITPNKNQLDDDFLFGSSPASLFCCCNAGGVVESKGHLSLTLEECKMIFMWMFPKIVVPPNHPF